MPEIDHAGTHARNAKRAEAWCETTGFHPELLPHSILFAIGGGIYAWARASGSNHGHSMPPAAAIVFGCIGFIAGGLFGYFGGLAVAKKRLQYKRWCEAHGWSFKAGGMPLLDGVVERSADAQHSVLIPRHQPASNIMSKRFGDRGASLHHASQNKVHFLYFVADSGGTCPDMILCHHKMASRFHIPHELKSVKFESNEFNRQWTVKAKDNKAAFARVNQGLMEYLLANKIPCAIEFKGGLLLVVSMQDGLVARTNLLLFAESLSKVVPDDLLPPYDFDADCANRPG